MENRIVSITNSCNFLFLNEGQKRFAAELIGYLLTDSKPDITPAIWQDAEIYARYKKRNVLHLKSEHFQNAEEAILVFSLKYILEHMDKKEIFDVLVQFFSQDKHKEDKMSLLDIFEKKLSAPIVDLFLTQEKVVVSPKMLKNFDELFQYPTWIEFDEEATEKCFQKILNDKFDDRQISFFLGASDDMKHYDRWFEVAKHVLMTTKNPQTFWTAGDILNIIWIVLPDDEKLQKWFRDQVFQIFWPRVGSIWPIVNREKIDFSANDELKITNDAIGWLLSLEDLRERLPELPENIELNLSMDEDEAFKKSMYELLASNDGDRVAYVGITERFFQLADMASTEEQIKDLEYVKKKMVEEFEVWSDKSAGFQKELEGAIGKAKKYVEDRKREAEVMKKYILGQEASA